MLGLSNVHGAFRQYLVRNRSFTTSGFPTDTMVPITDFVLFPVENIGQRGRLGFHAPRRYLLVCQVFVRNNGKLAYNGVKPMLTEKKRVTLCHIPKIHNYRETRHDPHFTLQQSNLASLAFLLHHSGHEGPD